MNKDILTNLAQTYNYTQHDADVYQAGATDYINSVWHDNTEKPDHDCWMLIEAEGNSCNRGFFATKFRISLNDTTCPVLWKDIIRWAYIEDLIPERKEEII